MSKQSKMLKDDILKILAKELSGGSNTRPAFESAKTPNTFFGGKDVGMQPYYPSAQEPAPAANPATPIVPGIISDKDPSKRPTYQSAKTPQTFIGGADDPKCKKPGQAVVKFCAKPREKKIRKPSAYNLFVKDFFSKNKGADMKSAAAAWKASKSGTAPAAKPAAKPAPAPKPAAAKAPKKAPAAKPAIKVT